MEGVEFARDVHRKFKRKPYRDRYIGHTNRMNNNLFKTDLDALFLIF